MVDRKVENYRPGIYTDPDKRDMQRQGYVKAAADQQAGANVIDNDYHPVDKGLNATHDYWERN